MDLFQEVIAHQQQQSAVNTLEQVLPQNEPADTVIQDWQQIFCDNSSKDVTFKLAIDHGKERKNDSTSFDYVACHKCILAAQSKELALLCSQTGLSRSKDHPTATSIGSTAAAECVLLLPGIRLRTAGSLESTEGPVISADAFRAMLGFIYFGEHKIPPLNCCELIPFAKDLVLPDLQRVCEMTTSNGITNDTALQILGVTYLAESDAVLKEIQQNSLNFILYSFDTIDLRPLRHMNPQIAIDLLLRRQELEKNGLFFDTTLQKPNTNIGPEHSNEQVQNSKSKKSKKQKELS